MVGKEWWISDKWGLGAGISYSKTNISHSAGDFSAKYDSNRIAIVLSVTLD